MDSSIDPDVAEWMREEHGKLAFDQPVVLRSKELTAGGLAELVAGRAACLHVSGFCPPSIAHRVIDMVDTEGACNWSLGPDNTDMHYLLGVPLQVAERGVESLRAYFAQAVGSIRRLRSLFAPHLSPVDRLRLELDECWPHGAHLADADGQKLAVGILRVMHAAHLLGGVARELGACHIDDLALSDTPRHLSANVYLRVPDDGGALAIWNLRPDAKNIGNRFYRLISGAAFKEGVQEIIHEIIGPPNHVIKPEVGDLLLFDSARPHAVQGFSAGSRVTIQSFVRVHGTHEPLTLHS